MRSAVAYIRVSRADKKRGLTLDVQRDSIREYAARQGLTLAQEYVDEGKSAYTNRIDKRPAFQQMLRDASTKGRAWAVVLVYKTDRFARDALLQLQCRRDLARLGVRTESATQYNPDDSAIGKLNVVLDAGLNEYYSALLSDRMRDVRRFEAQQQGRHVGPIPVGYDRVEGRLIPNAQAAAVRFAGEQYASGDYSAARMADLLTEAGYTNAEGEAFRVFAVEEMLKNPVYAGFVVCAGETFPGTHPPIWDAALWARMQEVRASRSRRRTRPAERHNPLLAGLLVCGACGAPMWHHPREGVRSYRCSSRPSGRGGQTGLTCPDQWAHAETIEATVLAWLGGLALTPDLFDRAQQRLAEQLPKAPNHDAELRTLKRQFLAEQISASDYEQRRAALQAPVAVAVAHDPAALLKLLRDVPRLLAAATPAERRLIVAQLITEVYARNKAVLAFRPTRLAESLFLAAAATDAWRAATLTLCSESGPGGHQVGIRYSSLTPSLLRAA